MPLVRSGAAPNWPPVRAQMVTAIAAMLSSAPDARFEDSAVTAMMALGVMMGPVQAVLGGRAPPEFAARLERELVVLLSSYLQAHRSPLKQSGKPATAI